MQPPPPPHVSSYARNRLPSILAVGAVILLVIGSVLGYLIGSAAVGYATLRVDVENRLATNQTVQWTVNGRLAGTLTIPSGQTRSFDVPVAFATANGSLFEVEAISTLGPRDASTVFVNTPGTYLVSLRLG